MQPQSSRILRSALSLALVAAAATPASPAFASAEQAQPAITPTPQPPVDPDDKIEPGLREQIQAAPNQQATFLVYLSQQADLSAADQIDDWAARGQFVFETLLQTAQSSQRGLLRSLQARQASGLVVNYRPFYIVNAVAVTANVATLHALAARPDVAFIESEQTYTIPQPIHADPLSTQAIEWGVTRIGADQVWSSYGVRGQGIVVANIDTGVLHSHGALQASYRGTTSGSHDYNWFDPNGSSTPFDNNGHGTHTMGSMVGDDGGSNQIGVAPLATWIAAKGCASSSCSSTDLLASAEWVLAPYPVGGSPSQGDPSMRPHVVNNSWGGGGGNTWYLSSVEAWRASDIFPAFSAGNSGPGSGTVGSPGDYAQSFASGATDSGDAIASFSSRGPSSLTSETKPDVSAPGVSVRSAWNNGSYNTISGTSMASPHTAGCVALIRAAVASLDVTQVEDLLTGTAIDLGSAGPDTAYGHGRIDCFAAVSAALNEPTPTPGTPTATPTTAVPTPATATPSPTPLTPTNTPITPTSTLTPSITPTPTFTALPPTDTPEPGVVFFDDFETERGWIRNPAGTDTATTGLWERGDPQGTSYGGPMQLGDTVSGINDLVTGRLAGSSVGAHDIDNGVTSIRSPDIVLPANVPLQLSFYYYLAHLGNSSPADFLRVQVVGSQSTQTVFEELGSGDVDTAAWAQFTTDLNSFSGQTIHLLIEAADASNPSLVEAAIDDLAITFVDGPTATPTPTRTPTPTLTPSNTPTPSHTPTPTLTPSNTPTPTPTPSWTPTWTPTWTATPTPEPVLIFFDDFETDLGWTRNPDGSDTATTGLWERGNPGATSYGVPLQLGDTVSGLNDLVTGASSGFSVGSNDIDNGVTSIRSPAIALPANAQIELSFYYYLAHLSNSSAADFLRVRVIGPLGSSLIFEELGSGDVDAGAWAQFTVSLSSYAGQSIYLLIEAADAGGPSLVEAAIDDLAIRRVVGPPP